MRTSRSGDAENAAETTVGGSVRVYRAVKVRTSGWKRSRAKRGIECSILKEGAQPSRISAKKRKAALEQTARSYQAPIIVVPTLQKDDIAFGLTVFFPCGPNITHD
jgi:hypothetical protein